jgi:ornithine carbamoyltransferase
MRKDLLSIKDVSSEDILEIFELVDVVKNQDLHLGYPLQDKNIALIFSKPSNRTRVSFEVGINQLGGKAIYLGNKEIRLGEREDIKDAGKVLARYVDGIVIRTFDHEDIVKLAKFSSVPIINGLSDMFHPCQVLADIFTIKEKIGIDNKKKIVYLGDGNNIVHSWLYGAAKLGLNLFVSTPEGYQPDRAIFEEALEIAQTTGAKIEYVADPVEAVKDADVVYTDVWASMGQESEKEKRRMRFAAYQVNSKLVEHAKKDFLFMHCLPVYRGQEVTDEVIDGTNSIVYDQAENRLHLQKAVMLKLMGKG